jgi:hypothetical protein
MASDDFNRENANPIGSPWTTWSGLSALRIVGDEVGNASGTNGSSGASHTSTELSSQVTIAAIDGGLCDGGPAICIGGGNGYAALNAANFHVYVFTIPGFSSVIDVTTSNWAPGDDVRLRRVGGDLIVSVNGIDLDDAPHSDYPTGNSGIFIFNGNVRVDDYTDGAAAGGVSITSVDPLRYSESATITGTGFGASQGGGSVEIGGVAQTVTSWSDTAIEITVVRGGLNYASGYTLTVTNNATEDDTATVDLLPQTDWDYVDLTSIHSDPDERITAAGDLEVGDQIAWDTQGGDVVVNDDATWDADEAVFFFDVEAWDSDDDTWGSVGTQRIDTLLVVADATHGHTVDNLTLTQSVTLTVADAAHAHTVDSPSLTQAHVLAVADATHAHAVDSPSLTQANTLAVADALHGHSADNITLSAGITLAIADAAHAHSVDNLALVQANVLSVNDASHGHSAESPTLTTGISLSVADALHAHAADNLILTQLGVLSVQDSTHAHTADSVILTQANVLVVNDALHSHLADQITLRIPADFLDPSILFSVKADPKDSIYRVPAS